MSTINSASTLEQVEAAYDDNASYAEDGSAAKCRAFITACRILLRRMPAESGTPEAHAKYTPDLIQREMAEAKKWLDANDPGGGDGGSAAGPRVVRGSFRDFR